MNLPQGWRHACALMITMLLLSSTGCGSKRSASSPTTMGFPASPYGEWANGPSSDPAYFPIGVWLQSPANAAAYRNMGVNLYVGLWQGPTQEQLSVLAAEGMQTICALNDVGREHLDDPTIVGWMHSDEPDNAQALPEGGWGDAVPTREIQADYAMMREQDPTRPVWLNLGQGVANEEWVGRAAPRETYPGYVAGTDIVSFDVYPISGIRKTDGERYMWWVAKGVDSLRHWGQDEKIVWNVIETTRINSDRGPTPDQVNSQVWGDVLSGAQRLGSPWTRRYRRPFLNVHASSRPSDGMFTERVSSIHGWVRSTSFSGLSPRVPPFMVTRTVLFSGISGSLTRRTTSCFSRSMDSNSSHAKRPQRSQ